MGKGRCESYCLSAGIASVEIFSVRETQAEPLLTVSRKYSTGMKPTIVHNWPRRLSDAAQIQRGTLAPLIDLYGTPPDEGLILGIECVFHESFGKVYCSAVLMRYPGFTEIERSLGEDDIPFPYALELSSFREGKVICKTLEKIKATPDLIMIHGDGVNSPSGIGVAVHIGIIFNIASIGCFRRFRTGERPRVARKKGSVRKIVRDKREIAAVFRSKFQVKPIYISPGYKVGLDDSVRIVQSMLRGFRMPEPIRVPHLLVMRHKSAVEKADKPAEVVRDGG